MLPKLLIWGASGHASVVADIVRLQGKYEIFGFIDDINPQFCSKQFCGYPIFGGQEYLDVCKAQGVQYIIFGFGNCQMRLKLSQLASEQGFSLATAIHPSSIIASDVSVAAGTVIAAGAVVNSGAKIGQNVILNTSSSVDHDCLIEDGSHICPGVHLAGKVVVERAAWVGIGATVVEKVRIGASSVIGAGAVVIGDIPSGVVAYGVPAKVIRKITVND
ncbi:acetyltransferase [Nostoc linckia FACHB-104]|nr:acetyltransferase [Nostoc linckia FACHB-104]